MKFVNKSKKSPESSSYREFHLRMNFKGRPFENKKQVSIEDVEIYRKNPNSKDGVKSSVYVSIRRKAGELNESWTREFNSVFNTEFDNAWRVLLHIEPGELTYLPTKSDQQLKPENIIVAYTGTDPEIKPAESKFDCPACGGFGFGDNDGNCERCGGSGHIDDSIPEVFSQLDTEICCACHQVKKPGVVVCYFCFLKLPPKDREEFFVAGNEQDKFNRAVTLIRHKLASEVKKYKI